MYLARSYSINGWRGRQNPTRKVSSHTTTSIGLRQEIYSLLLGSQYTYLRGTIYLNIISLSLSTIIIPPRHLVNKRVILHRASIIGIDLPNRLLALTLGPNLYNGLTIFIILKNKPSSVCSRVSYLDNLISTDPWNWLLFPIQSHRSLLRIVRRAYVPGLASLIR